MMLAKLSSYLISIPFSAELALRCVSALLAISVCVVTVEFGILLMRGQLGSGTLFDWHILRLRRLVVNHPFFLKPIDLLFSSTMGTALWLVTGLAAAIGTTAGFRSRAGILWATLLVGFLLSLALRFPVGRDGADQLAIFFSIALLAYLLTPSQRAARIAVYLICAEMTGGYFVSGVSKLTAIAWRRGDALHAILRSSCYGNPPLAAAVGARPVWLLGIAVALLEASFPLIWLMHGHVGMLLLLTGFSFHLSVWLIMGLNSFFFTFAAGYPALLWLALSGH